MRADAGLAAARPVRDRESAGGEPGRGHSRALLAAGAVVAALAAGAYLLAIACHPMAALLKGFDLQVYLGGARQALTRPGQLYSWTYQGHPGIQFTYTPFAALLFAAGLAVPFPALMAGATAVSVLALVATVSIAFRALGWSGARRLGATLLVAGLALWTEPVQRALFLGQVEIVLMALVTWDLSQPAGRRWRGAATGLAAGVKLVPLLFIAYLLLTRQLRAAAVAAVAFAVTVAAGFAALPSASATWWLGGAFFQAGRTGFVGGQQNQSLRGLVTRLAGSVAGGSLPWLVLAALAGLAGLAAATALHQAGYSFAGLLTGALTALLVSPISWDHHWVWIAPGLALLVDGGARAARAWTGLAWFTLAGALAAVFAAWPEFWKPGAGLLGGGLINYAPATAWAHGDNPAYLEYHWNGLRLIAGNLEILTGIALFVIAVAAAWRIRIQVSRL
jgi:alpha-1,2-mannosyltransferase